MWRRKKDWRDDRIAELEQTLLASSNANVNLLNKNSLLQDDLRRATERWRKACDK